MTRKLAAYAVVLGTALVGMGSAVVARYRASRATDPLAAAASPAAAVSVVERPGEVSLALLTARSTRAAAACLRARASSLAPSLALDRPGPGAATPAYVTEARLAAGQLPPGLPRDHLRGFSDADRATLGGVRLATVLHLRPEPPALASLEDAMRLVAGCADESGALVADPSTGELFTARAFRAHRVRTWERGLPSLPDQLVVASIALPDGRVELRTSGLAKFGLPEVAVATERGLEPRLTRVVGLAAQTLVERGSLDASGRLAVDPVTLRHSRLRASPPASACPPRESDRADFGWRLEDGAAGDGPDAGTLGVAAAVSGPAPRPRSRRLVLTLLERPADASAVVTCGASAAQTAAASQGPRPR